MFPEIISKPKVFWWFQGEWKLICSLKLALNWKWNFQMTNKGLTGTIRDLILHLKKLQKTEGTFTAINIQNEGGILESQNSNRTIQQSKPNRLHDFLCISNQVAKGWGWDLGQNFSTIPKQLAWLKIKTNLNNWDKKCSCL